LPVYKLTPLFGPNTQKCAGTVVVEQIVQIFALGFSMVCKGSLIHTHAGTLAT
jgi:hypothetical protein